MVSGQRTSTFGDDVGMWHLVFVGSFAEDVDNVIDIFLHGIVHRTLGVGGTCAIIVHSEASSAVYKFDVESHLAELHVVLCHFAECSTDETDFGNLTPDVEVNELQTIFQTFLFQTRQSCK